MATQFLNDRTYPVDIRLGIIYNDPYEDEAECGLGSEKYHGLGTIGIKGIHLSTSEMYQDFRIEPARTEPSAAYQKWAKSGFHTFINPDEGLDTKPVRPSGLDILRECDHNTDGSVCIDCLRRAAEAEKILIREKNETPKQAPRQSGLKPTSFHKNDLLLGAEESETEIFAPLGDLDDDTVMSDPVEVALMRLEFGTRPESRREDVAVVRTALDKTFSLQQQLTEAQRIMHRALLAEIQRTTESTEELIEKLLKLTTERDKAYQDAQQTQRQLNEMIAQRDRLIELSYQVLAHFKVQDEQIELALQGQTYKLDGKGSPLFLQSILKLWKYVRTLPNTLKQSLS